MPRRDLTKESIKLDREASYPEQFLVDGATDLIASVVFRNADNYWGPSADRADRRLTVWRVSREGGLTPILAMPVSADIAPEAFVSDRFIMTAPKLTPQAAEVKGHRLTVWAADLEERLRLACTAADGGLSDENWDRFIGRFTEEAPRPTCRVRGSVQTLDERGDSPGGCCTSMSARCDDVMRETASARDTALNRLCGS